MSSDVIVGAKAAFNHTNPAFNPILFLKLFWCNNFVSTK